MNLVAVGLFAALSVGWVPAGVVTDVISEDKGDDQQQLRTLLVANEEPAHEARTREANGSVARDEGFIWPIEGAVLSGFGPRDGGMHTGLDIDSDAGDPIEASAGGEVVLSDVYYGYGLAVIIEHGHGLSTLYGHLSTRTVAMGDVVEQGDVVGLVGCTGDCSGDHLHFEVRVDDEPVPPTPFLRDSDPELDRAPDAFVGDPYLQKHPLAPR